MCVWVGGGAKCRVTVMQLFFQNYIRANGDCCELHPFEVTFPEALSTSSKLEIAGLRSLSDSRSEVSFTEMWEKSLEMG